MRRRNFVIFPILIAGVVMLLQYCSSEKITNPITGRSARVALSSEQEETLGLQSFREVLSQSDVIERGPEHDLVVQVAGRLARATGDDAKDFKWQVSVVKSSQANAFCLPGGKIVVSCRTVAADRPPAPREFQAIAGAPSHKCDRC